jgi:hypothetical protein
MRDWTSRKDCQDGKTEFWQKLLDPHNSGIKNECINDKAKARVHFARLANFQLEEDPSANKATAIPKDVEFRVFDDDVKTRRKLVTIVLRNRPPGTPFEQETQDHEQVWMCTYFPY